jgi:hypothetical protein
VVRWRRVSDAEPAAAAPEILIRPLSRSRSVKPGTSPGFSALRVDQDGRLPRPSATVGCLFSGLASQALINCLTRTDPVYQTVLVQVERIFWRCVQTGEVPRVFGAEPPRAKLPIVRIVDMGPSNAWAEYAAIFARTRAAHAEHESARAELKALVPEDAREAFGHGVRAKRSRAGAVFFELMANGGSHALP